MTTAVTESPGPELVSAPFGEALAELGRTRPDVAVLAADLSKYTDVIGFAESHPDRFVQIGMAEQNLMGVAAGLSKSGLVPIITTYCVFATRRAYEQVALALCTARRPLVIAAFLPGITTPFRATHQGTDDLALMRNIPGMTIVDPMDATELRAALLAAVDLGGPVYLRGMRGLVAQHFDPGSYRFTFGRTQLLRDGGDIGIISTGLGSSWAMEAAELLASRGIETAVLHVPTVKPLAEQDIQAFAARFPAVFTVENHSRTGGLGTAVAERLAEVGARCRLHRLGIGDSWPPAGSLDYIRTRLGLDPAGLADTIEYRAATATDRSTDEYEH